MLKILSVFSSRQKRRIARMKLNKFEKREKDLWGYWKKDFFSEMGFSACAQEILHPKPSPSLSLSLPSLPFFPPSPSLSFSPSASPSPSLSMPEMPNVPGYQACRSNDSFHPSIFFCFSLSLLLYFAHILSLSPFLKHWHTMSLNTLSESNTSLSLASIYSSLAHYTSV